MRAAVMRGHDLVVEDVSDPVPKDGEVLVKTLACGICGSDLHTLQHADRMVAMSVESGAPFVMDLERPVVMGHEFCAEVLELGPNSGTGVSAGDRIVSLPVVIGAAGMHSVGYSNDYPGGYGELMALSAMLALKVPNGLSSELAALTEPMAVGRHAVLRGEVKKRDLAIVIGCGPVGLAVISMLKAEGVRHVVASDPSPGRRALATKCGADVVVDPREDSPYAASEERGHFTTVPALVEFAVGTMEKLERVPLPSHHIMRVADALGVKPKRPVIFECVGVPGLIDGIIAAAPLYSRVVVVGVCMDPDRIRPAMAINKEIDLRFVIGYTPLEFRDTLHMLAEGKVDAKPIVTGTVGLSGVESAFEALGNPEAHAKILIDPKSAAAAP